MATGDPVADDDLVLRRFNPAEKSHYWFDQEGVGEKHFRSGGLSYGSDGFSVFQESKLLAMELGREVVLLDSSWRIAGATAGDIRRIERGGRNLLNVIEDPQPVDDHGEPARNLAHALIVLPPNTNGSQVSAWARRLAKELAELPLTR